MKKDFTTGYLLDFYGPLLTERQREALDMYYNMDYSLSEIAAHFSVTRQCVRGYLKNGEAHVRRMESVLHHAALYGAAEKACEILSASSEESAKQAVAFLKSGMEREIDGI